MRQRNLYKFVDEVLVPKPVQAHLTKVTAACTPPNLIAVPMGAAELTSATRERAAHTLFRSYARVSACMVVGRCAQERVTAEDIVQFQDSSHEKLKVRKSGAPACVRKTKAPYSPSGAPRAVCDPASPRVRRPTMSSSVGSASTTR